MTRSPLLPGERRPQETRASKVIKRQSVYLFIDHQFCPAKLTFRSHATNSPMVKKRTQTGLIPARAPSMFRTAAKTKRLPHFDLRQPPVLIRKSSAALFRTVCQNQLKSRKQILIRVHRNTQVPCCIFRFYPECPFAVLPPVIITCLEVLPPVETAVLIKDNF